MHHVRWVGRYSLLLLLATSLLYACGPRPGAPEDAPGQAREATATHAADLADATAGPEAAEAPVQSSGHSPQTRADTALFTGDTLAKIQRGMAPGDVAALAGTPGYAIGGDGGAIRVVRYEDPQGNYFTVRYDHGALRTHSGLHQAQPPPTGMPHAASAPSPPAAAGDRPVAEIAPGVFIPLERAVTASSSQPRGVDSTPVPVPPDDARDSSGIRWSTPDENGGGAGEPARERSVVVAGGRNRDDGGQDARSYRPRARLPDFTRSLGEGVFELRFVNPGEAAVRVGIRRDNLGLDTTVPPGDRASMKVDRGVYQLYFIRESEPYTRYEAEPIRIDGLIATDLEIRLDPEDVAVSPIDYGGSEL